MMKGGTHWRTYENTRIWEVVYQVIYWWHTVRYLAYRYPKAHLHARKTPLYTGTCPHMTGTILLIHRILFLNMTDEMSQHQQFIQVQGKKKQSNGIVWQQ